MEQAVCGIRGTTFALEAIKGKSILRVIEGKVEFTSKADGRKTEPLMQVQSRQHGINLQTNN